MLRAQLHDAGHVVGAGRAHAGKGVGAEPMLRHVEGDRLIAVAFVARAQSSARRAGGNQVRRARRSQRGLGGDEQRLGRA